MKILSNYFIRSFTAFVLYSVTTLTYAQESTQASPLGRIAVGLGSIMGGYAGFKVLYHVFFGKKNRTNSSLYYDNEEWSDEKQAEFEKAMEKSRKFFERLYRK